MFNVEMLNLNVSDKGTQTFSEKVWDEAIKHIHKKGDFTPQMMTDQPVMEVIRETGRVLSDATAKGTLNYKVPQETTDMLTQNVFKFSGFKSYQQLAHANTLLKDNKGNVKPFSSFKKEVLEIHKTYNVNYLRTEYNFATASAQAAGQWAEIAADGDEYNLQYRTAYDEKVRSSHAALNNTTLPLSDPFWEEYYPPNGWNCRCKAVRVRKDKYQVSDSKESIERGERATTQIGKGDVNKAAMFRFNPGKSQTIFPDKHPYYKVNQTTKNVVMEAAKKAVEQSRASQERERYTKEMQPLLLKEVVKTITENKVEKDIRIGFNKRGNKHLYSDTFGRAKEALLKSDLKNLDKILKRATFVKKAGLSKDRKDNIECFYYFKTKLNGKDVYLNVAKEVVVESGRNRTNVFLYAVTKEIVK